MMLQQPEVSLQMVLNAKSLEFSNFQPRFYITILKKRLGTGKHNATARFVIRSIIAILTLVLRKGKHCGKKDTC